MATYKFSIVLLAGISLLPGMACNANGPDKHSEEADKGAVKLRGQIQEEIKTLGKHDWAGEYYCGDGLGVNISLLVAPKAGFLFGWHGCLGLYDRNYGPVTWKDGRLRLSFTLENKREGFQGIAEEFIPISWGERKYLIPSNEIVNFCNEVNEGSEPRQGLHGFHLLRSGDAKKKVKGFPAVPQEFKPYLLTRPIQVGIVAVGKYVTRPSVCDWKFKDTSVTLNCGKKQGLLQGMKLHVIKPDHIIESVTVTKVEEVRSEAVMTQIGEKEAGPQVGWELSTRCRWHSVSPE